MNKSSFRELIGPRRLKEILDGASVLSGLVVQVTDCTGRIFGRSGTENRCRLDLTAPCGDTGRLLVPGQCFSKKCPLFKNQYFSPVNAYHENLGMVIGCAEHPVPNGRLHVEFLSRILSEIATGEMEIAAISADIVSKYEELSILYQVSRRIAASFSEKEVCSLSVSMAAQALNVSTAIIYLLSREDNVYRCCYSLAGEDTVREGEELPLDLLPVVEHVIETEKALVNDDRVLAGAFGNGFGSRSTLLSPLVYRGELDGKASCLGLMLLADKKVGSFSSGDQRFIMSLSAQAALGIANCRVIDQLRERVRLKRDIELAQSIQESFFPKEAPSGIGFDIHGLCLPAERVGGDYFDFFRSPDGSIVLMVADVAGHHLGSAILMASTRAVLRTHSNQEAVEPSYVLQAANKTMCGDFIRAGSFVSSFVAAYDPATKRLEYASAGHNPPLLFEPAVSPEVEWLSAEGMLIGILEEVEFDQAGKTLSPGSVLVLYTDGVVEAVDSEQNFFGTARLAELIKSHHRKSAQDICNAIVDGINEFVDGNDHADDITVVVLKTA